MKPTNLFKGHIYSFISLILLIVPFYFIGLNFLIFICLIPFFYVIDWIKKKDFPVFLYYLIFYMAVTFFINKVSVEVKVSYLTYIALFMALSILNFIFYKSIKYFVKNIFNITKLSDSLIFVIAQIFFESIMFMGDLSFPWFVFHLPVGVYPFFVSISSFTGSFSISIIVLLINYFLYKGFFENFFTGREIIYCIKIRYMVGIFIIFLILLLTFFFNPYDKKLIKTKLKVAVVQPDIPLNFKYRQKYFKIAIDRYLKYSKMAINKDNVSLVCWSESSFPKFFRYEHYYRNTIIKFAKQNKIGIVLSFPDAKKIKNKIYYYNTAGYISKNGNLNIYYKIHRVPFGEFIPFREKFKFLSELIPEVGINIKAGNFIKPFQIEKGKNIYKFYPTICFESIYSYLFIKFKKLGADFFLNLTNDSWYQGTYQQNEHLYFNVFRAVEFKTTIFRSATTGISAIITPEGKIKKKLLFKDKGFISDYVVYYPGKTFYAKYGYIYIILFHYLSVILLLSYILITLILFFRNLFLKIFRKKILK